MSEQAPPTEAEWEGWGQISKDHGEWKIGEPRKGDEPVDQGNEWLMDDSCYVAHMGGFVDDNDVAALLNAVPRLIAEVMRLRAELIRCADWFDQGSCDCTGYPDVPPEDHADGCEEYMAWSIRRAARAAGGET